MIRYLALAALALSAALVAPEAHAQQSMVECLDVTKAAGTDDERYLSVPWKGTWEITDITFAPATAVAAHASNVVATTISINAGTASTSWTTIATHTTDSDLTGYSAYVIGTVIDLSLTKPTNVGRGYQIRIQNTNGGTGAAWDGSFCLAFRKVG